ncbi:hypothetical protein OAU13_00885 [bacterium]|nr:hypothetical protein [bacterium]
MSVAPIYKGTCLLFDDTDVRYSYLTTGTIEFLDNCTGVEGNIVSGGSFWNVYPSIKFDNEGKCVERMIAVHEDGELCCFISKTNIIMNVVDVDGEYKVGRNTSLLVMDGSLLFNGNKLGKHNMIRERHDEFVVSGKARTIEITY